MTLHTDEDGFVMGFVRNAQEAYLRNLIPTKHPALNSGTAKLLVRECPEDAWRQHPASGLRVKRETSDAMDAGSVLDALLTGPKYLPAPAPTGLAVYTYKSGKQAGQQSTCAYEEWNGLRIVDCDDFKSGAAQNARDTAAGLTVIKRADFARELAQLDEIRARMELAGVNMDAGERQTAVYWVETASDGTRVQCRGLLDQVIFDRDDDHEVCHVEVRDLKRVASLRGDRLARQVDDYGWHIQAAAYRRGVRAAMEQRHGCTLPTSFAWVFVRTDPSISVTVRPQGDSLHEVGELEWLLAVDRWAAGLKSGLWSGYEQDTAPLEATPYMLARAETTRLELDDAEAAQ